MSDLRERSGIFKFFYVVLSIITFPIFAIIYIIKHPKWILFFMVLAGGILAYFPLKDGENINNIVEWYKKKYNYASLKIVSKAIEGGNEKFIPQNLLVKAKEMQKELKDIELDETKVKGENFNDRIIRDDEFEELAVKLNKKGGFKQKGETDREAKVEVLVEEGQKAGGLYELMQKHEEKVESDAKKLEEAAVIDLSLSDEESLDELNKETYENEQVSNENNKDVKLDVATEVSQHKVEKVVEPNVVEIQNEELDLF
jgi:hypothetical protein